MSELVYIGGFSGGIDSQAAARFMLNRYGTPCVVLVNADAGGNEHPLTVEQIDWYSGHVHPVIRITAKVGDFRSAAWCEQKGVDPRADLAFPELARIKGRFPSRRAQFCTEALKLAPIRRWIEEHYPRGDYARFTGVRRDESLARSQREWQEWDDYYDYELYNPVYDWSKPNPMPESVTDRPTKSHEYVSLLAKSDRYFYDAEAIKEIAVGGTPGNITHKQQTAFDNGDAHMRTKAGLTEMVAFARHNKRSVWTIAVEAFPGAHFATFPAKLIEPCILAGTSEYSCCAQCGVPWARIVKRSVDFQSGSGRAGNVPEGKYIGSVQAESGDYDIRLGPVVTTSTLGWELSCSCSAEITPCTVLDPFNGAGTTGLVALRLGRSYIGIELNPEYVAMSQRRIREDAPLFRQGEQP